VLWPGRVRAAFAETLGEGASVDEGFGPITVDVPPASWEEAVEVARDGLDCTFFDWLSAVDECQPEPVEGQDDGFRIVCHVADHRIGGVDHLVIRTLIPREGARVASIAHLFAGARWHERETHEMFGVDFTVDGAPLQLDPLLLPENFEGHPLRKDFILASRVAKPFPGAKEPGEAVDVAHAASPARRRTRPAGVPEPEQWGPREPGTERPNTLAAAAAGPASARPRRTPRARPTNEPPSVVEPFDPSTGSGHRGAHEPPVETPEDSRDA
jgi:NADH-quinone oxidoreductase subunit C